MVFVGRRSSCSQACLIIVLLYFYKSLGQSKERIIVCRARLETHQQRLQATLQDKVPGCGVVVWLQRGIQLQTENKNLEPYIAKSMQISSFTPFEVESAVQVESLFDVATLEFAPEFEHILCKTLRLLNLAGLYVVLDSLCLDLVDGQLAEVGLGQQNDLSAVELIDGLESVRFELRLAYFVFVLFVEDGVKYSLGFDFSSHVGSPDGSCCVFVGLIAVLGWNDHKLFEGVVEVLLVVVVGRIFNLLDFVLAFIVQGVFRLLFFNSPLFIVTFWLQNYICDCLRLGQLQHVDKAHEVFNLAAGVPGERVEVEAVPDGQQFYIFFGGQRLLRE